MLTQWEQMRFTQAVHLGLDFLLISKKKKFPWMEYGLFGVTTSEHSFTNDLACLLQSLLKCTFLLCPFVVVVFVVLCLGFFAITLLLKSEKFEELLIIVGLFTFECPACTRSAPFHLSFGVFQCLSTKQTPRKLFGFENS